MSGKPRAAIFILTQNNAVRRTYLKTCLYFLFKHFNAEHRYPVMILHEGDYDPRGQEEILRSVRSSCRSLVSFVQMDTEDFTIPAHIDQEKMRRCIATKAVPYWRNDKYRMMCRWWMVHMHKYAAGYEYVMRIDDDSIIEEPVKNDLFQWFDDKKLMYASNMIHIDCGVCCYGMKEFFEENVPEAKHEFVRQMFVKQEIPTRAVQFMGFRALLSILHENNEKSFDIQDKMELWMPIMYYNNWFITRTSFWQREEVKDMVDKIDKNGSIFYCRWGDAPLQSAVAMLFAKPEEVSRAIFKYSKRLQREAFEDDDGRFHSFMPDTYDKSSCITETNPHM